MIKSHMQKIMEAQKCATCRNKNRACDNCDPLSETGQTNYEEKSEFRAIFGVTMSAREVALSKEKSDLNFFESILAIQTREIEGMSSIGKKIARPELAKAAINEARTAWEDAIFGISNSLKKNRTRS